jgi:hypothetical protein
MQQGIRAGVNAAIVRDDAILSNRREKTHPQKRIGMRAPERWQAGPGYSPPNTRACSVFLPDTKKRAVETRFVGDDLEHLMETVRIYPLTTLRKGYAQRLREAHMEAARVWIVCRDLHLAARCAHISWPQEADLQQATKGQFALHSQTVQLIFHTFLANIETTRELRRTNPKMRYPYKDKQYYPLLWPAQAVSVERGRIVFADGTLAPFARVQARPARAHWRVPTRLEGWL